MSQRKKTRASIAFVAAAVLAIGIGVGFTACAPTEDTVQAHALTSVRNSGIPGATSQSITVVRDNGTYTYPVAGGATVWGVKAVRVEQGTCISINSGTPKCATSGAYNVALGINSYNIRRTK